MVNVPDWERVGDAAKRVMLTGITENVAQLALCRAILNRQIRVRIYLGKFESGDFCLQQTMWGEVGLIIPPHLAPRDFDWSQSSPLKPWRDFREGISGIFRNWRQDRIDVFCDDVTKVLCGRKQAKGVHAGPSGRRGPDSKARRGTPMVPMRKGSEQKPTKRGRKTASQRRVVALVGPGEQEYAPAREPLSEALKRFLAAGFSSVEAEKLICRALADRKIRYRWRAVTEDQVLSGLPPAMAAQIQQGLRDEPAAWRGQMENLYPRHLMGETLPLTSSPKPDDFDWRKSCFKNHGILALLLLRNIAVFGLSSFKLTSRGSYLMVVG